MQPGLSTRSESVVQRYNEHLAVAPLAIAHREDNEVLARGINGFTHYIAELVQTVGLADQRKAIVLWLHLVGRRTLDQFFQQPSHG